jgi:hypothetical protein
MLLPRKDRGYNSKMRIREIVLVTVMLVLLFAILLL